MESISKISVKGTEYELHDSGTDQYAKKLWSGSNGGGGSISVNGIGAYRLIALKVDKCNHLIVFDRNYSGNVSSCGNFGERAYDVCVVTIGGVSIKENSLRYSSSLFALYQSAGLGQALLMSAGDTAKITEIWGIM